MSIDAITKMNWELEQSPGRITLKEVGKKEVPGRKLQRIREVQEKPDRGGPEKAKQKEFQKGSDQQSHCMHRTQVI